MALKLSGFTLEGFADGQPVLLFGPAWIAGSYDADRPSLLLLISIRAAAMVLDRLQPVFSVGLVREYHSKVEQSLRQQWEQQQPQHRRSQRLQAPPPSAEQLFRSAAAALNAGTPQPLTERSQWIGWEDKQLGDGLQKVLVPQHLELTAEHRLRTKDEERQTRYADLCLSLPFSAPHLCASHLLPAGACLMLPGLPSCLLLLPMARTTPT